VAIVWLSLMRQPPTIDLEQGDKLGHFAAYGLLMLLFCMAHVSTRARAMYATGFILMGIGLEFLQGMTDYRTFDVFDMLANAVGVALGWTAVFVLEKFRHD
jgi:glycopeptide antibiotics resistance protein